MASFLERLRAALADHYDVDHEIGRGGMGTVFKGRHRALDKPVAIKALRDDVYSYTAAAKERFILEGKTLALFTHPHIVPVHDADTAKGIPYYVMDYLAGPTLENRLATERLAWREIVDIGCQLLDALGAAHRRDVIHRDVKPANILFQDGRLVLVDFGIAKRINQPASDPLTGDRDPPGTRDWMSPEQLAGAELTPRSDLYLAGLVLYKMLTGANWSATSPRGAANWDGVPRRLRPVLARALRPKAAERWPDAAAFRSALERAAARWPWPARVAAALAFVAVVAGVAWVLRPPAPAVPIADALVAPFSGTSVPDQSLGREVARFASLALENFQPGHTVVDSRSAFGCWDGGLAPGETHLTACGRRARAVVEGATTRHGDTAEVQLTILAAKDQRILASPRVSGPSDSVDLLARRTATAVVRALGWGDTVAPTFCGANPQALAAFNRGEEAFDVDDWPLADQQYSQAFALDSTCALAAWRLSVVRAWRRAPLGIDLQRLVKQPTTRLPPVVRQLLRATLTPSGPERLARFDTAVTSYPGESYAWLLYGNELWSRGALSGVPLDSAEAVLRHAARIDPSVPAFDHIAWLNIRRGRRAEARAALDAIHRPGPGSGDVDLPGLLELGYRLRFAPESVTLDSTTLARMQRDVAVAVRFALTVDVPEGQRKFAALLTAAAAMTPAERANGHEAQGVALVALGRIREALPHFDSAAALFGERAVVEPAEWRLLLAALDLPPADSVEVTRGRATLERLAGGRAADPRAVWDLAVAAYAVGDTTTAARWTRAFRPATAEDSAAGRAFVALQRAARGRFADAVALARPLGWMDAEHLPRYPFLRALMHARQGEWLRRSGATLAADSAWAWYDNADAALWPDGPAQAGDVDWVLATAARLWRAQLDATPHAACDAARVAELLAHADLAYATLTARARLLGQRCQS